MEPDELWDHNGYMHHQAELGNENSALSEAGEIISQNL